MTVSKKMASDRFVYIIKRKLNGGLKIRILFSQVKNNILPLENKNSYLRAAV